MSTDKRKPLGRGLDSLLPAARGNAPAAAAPAAPRPGETVQEIPLDRIEPNPYQTRTRVDEAALNELAASIKASGVLQPVVLRFVGEGKKLQLIAGERRWMASQRAGRTTVPAIVRQVSNEQAMEMTIIENLQREDLSPIEQAKAFDRLSREFNLTQEQMAQKTGKDRSSVANYLRLLKLPAAIQDAVDTAKLTMGHAKALMMLDSPEAILRFGTRVAEGGLSVRETERLVHLHLHPPERPAAKPAPDVDPNVREAERELQQTLGCKVKITDKKGKGTIEISYASLEDFDRILEALSAKK